MSINDVQLTPATRPWTRGRVSAFVRRNALVWELALAGLIVVYVVLAFLQDQGWTGLITAGVFALALVFVAEFSVRLYDAPSRLGYCRSHWLDIVTCIPVVGSFRLLRLVRLLAFIRLGATTRSFGLRAATSERVHGGIGLWVLAPLLLVVWGAASYGYYELEGGVNPHVQSFSDAMYFSFVTASTVGYGDVTPITPAGKVLSGVLIFLGIGLLGFASAQLTAKLLPQKNEMLEMKTALDHQVHLLTELVARLDAVNKTLEHRLSADPIVSEAEYQLSELV